MKVLYYIVNALYSVFVILTIACLLLTLTVYNNERATLIFSVFTIAFGMCAYFIFVIMKIIKNKIRRNHPKQKDTDHLFCNIYPVSNGWNCYTKRREG